MANVVSRIRKKLNPENQKEYITDSVFENCVFDTKDAFWHGKNITVRNSIVKGEYLAWCSENITFEKLINCEMIDTDLSFERSEVEVTLIAPIVTIKSMTVCV